MQHTTYLFQIGASPLREALFFFQKKCQSLDPLVAALINLGAIGYFPFVFFLRVPIVYQESLSFLFIYKSHSQACTSMHQFVVVHRLRTTFVHSKKDWQSFALTLTADRSRHLLVSNISLFHITEINQKFHNIFKHVQEDKSFLFSFHNVKICSFLFP